MRGNFPLRRLDFCLGPSGLWGFPMIPIGYMAEKPHKPQRPQEFHTRRRNAKAPSHAVDRATRPKIWGFLTLILGLCPKMPLRNSLIQLKSPKSPEAPKDVRGG
jgi:hypothetical protein